MQPNQPLGQGYPTPTPGPANEPNPQNIQNNYQPAQQMSISPQPQSANPIQPSFNPPQPNQQQVQPSVNPGQPATMPPQPQSVATPPMMGGSPVSSVPAQPQPGMAQPINNNLPPQAPLGNFASPSGPQQFPPASGGMGMVGGQPPIKQSPLAGLLPKLKFIIPAVVLIIIVLVGAFFAKSMLFDSSKLKSGDLVEQKIGDASIKGPKNWKPSEESLGSVDEVYTMNGVSSSEAEEGKESPLVYAVNTEDMGYDFDASFTADQKKVFADYVKDGLAAEIESTFNSGSGDDNFCSDVKDTKVTQDESSEFSLKFTLTAKCTDESKSVNLHMIMGVDGSKVYTLIIAGYEDFWLKNQKVIDEMITSFKPAS